MDDRSILDVALVADGDGIRVAANDGRWPHGNPRAQGDITEHDSGWMDESGWMDHGGKGLGGVGNLLPGTAYDETGSTQIALPGTRAGRTKGRPSPWTIRPERSTVYWNGFSVRGSEAEEGLPHGRSEW